MWSALGSQRLGRSMASPIGEYWKHPQHPTRRITRIWMDGDTFNEDGTPIRWAEFDGDRTLTYNYDELTDFGWTQEQAS